MEILAIGNVFDSISLMVDSFCQIDGEMVANNCNKRVSGSAIVVSAMASYLEESANVIFKAKKSSTIKKYIDLLESRSANVTLVPVKECNTLITVYDKNLCRQCYSYLPNSIDYNDLKEIDFAKYEIVFFCSLPYQSISDLFTNNMSINSTCTVLLPNGFLPTYFREGKMNIKTDYLFMNEAELTNLLEKKTNNKKSIKDLVMKLDDSKTNIIVTRGRKGLSGYVNGKYFENSVPEISNIVHPGGAGDAFATGFMIAVMKGMPLSDCCSVGHQCASKMLSVFNTEEFLRGNNEIVWEKDR